MAPPSPYQTFRYAGYPALTKKFRNPNNVPGAITVDDNEEVQMLALKGDWVNVFVLATKVQGHVPKQFLVPGFDRKVGDFSVIHDLPEVIDISGTIITPTLEKSLRDRPFIVTIRRLIVEYREQAATLRCIPDWYIARAATPASVDALEKVIVEGTRQAGTLQTFLHPHFNVNDIIQYGTTVGNDNQRSGIYVWVHWDFKDDPDRKPALYVGKTNHFGVRYGSHNLDSKTRNTSHYRTWRKARKHIMKMICIVDNAEARSVAQQIFTNMLYTYAPHMIDFNATVISRDIDEAYDEDEELERDLEAKKSDPNDEIEVDMIDIEELSPGSSPSTNHYNMKETAFLFNNLAKAVFKATGWIGGCHEASFGASNGTNMDSCLVGYAWGDPAVWTAQEIPGAVRVYMRRPRRCAVDKQTGVRVLSIAGRKPQPFRLNLGKNETPGPEHGDLVYANFEVALTGPHNVPFGLFPEVGYFEDHLRLNQLGISISWKSKNGNWHRRYVQAAQRGRSGETLVPQERGVYLNAGGVMGLLNYLEQRTFKGDHPYARYMGVAHVKNVHWDFLKQELRFTERQAPPPEAVPIPRQDSEIMADLRALTKPSQTRFGGWMTWPAGKGKGSHDRKSCDRCFVPRGLRHQNTTGPCTKLPDKDVCGTCHSFGNSVCGWSSREVMVANQAYREAIWYTRPRQYDGDNADSLIVEDDLEPEVYQGAWR